MNMKVADLNYCVLLLLFVCYGSGPCAAQSAYAIAPVDSATSVQLAPNLPAAYYVEQGVKYFGTMATAVPRKIKPEYSPLVIRWEWHPWLLLTGYRRINLINTDNLLKLYNTKYDTIDCRYFDKEPFCRCHVMFNYGGTRIPIYEEFTFNNQGQITFIEAWSDYPSLIPMKTNDYWAQGNSVRRLSTRVPGLGNATGSINIGALWMKAAAAHDPDLADLLHRLHHPIITYIKELTKQRKAMAAAKYPPVGDIYPYGQ
jgi:hypothetical protein